MPEDKAKPENKTIDDATLASIISNRTSDAESLMTTISFERENSLKLYNQELYGNERDGFSQFVTSEVRDTIEWILPQLIEMFISGDNPVIFTPQNDKDIEGAKQESQYVRYVYNRQNNGFLNTYTWFKDALMQKNGIVKAFWDDNIQDTKEEYQKQSFAELMQIAEDEELEVTAIVMKVSDKKVSTFKTLEELNSSIESGETTVIDETGNLLDITFDIKADRSLNLSQVTIKPIAPENFWIDPTYNSLDFQDAPFCREDILDMTVSDLLVEGFDKETIDKIPSSKFRLNDSEQTERYRKESGVFKNIVQSDDENRKVDVSDVYLRIDMDGDGIAELRHIKIGGDTVILSNEEVDKIPYFTLTPNINTHKVYGMSVADMIADIQLLSSTIMRQTLDSLYLSNNPRHAVLRGHVELDDLMTSQVGGIVREDVPNAVRPLLTPFVGQHSIPMMELVSQMNEKRTGVSSTTQGLNPEALADSTNMVGSMIMNAAQGRIKMIARIFGEVGFKPLMLYVHELVLKNEDNKKIADLGGEFVEVNPTDWKTRRDMVVKVGIGHAEKKEKILALERTLMMQKEAFAAQGGVDGPLVTAQKIHNTITDLLELTGLDSGDRYFADPAKFQAPPPKEDATSEALEIAEAELTAKTVEAANRFKLDVEKERAKAANDTEKLAVDKAKVLLEAQGTAQQNRVEALFKAAEMQGKEEDRIFNVLKEAVNVQNEQQAAQGVDATGQGIAGQQGVPDGTGGGF